MYCLAETSEHLYTSPIRPLPEHPVSDLLTRLQTSLAEKYAIECELGRGGMATVFLARDRRLDRKVAIKVLHQDLSQALGAERFRREIDIATRLSHPHILPLYDSGEADGLLYYVMPYVTGESLRARLKREQQLSVEETVQVSCEVASALDYAHRQGVIHRDIKPENILLADGHAVVADFGIARAISASQDSKLTQTGVTLGTPMYMSPEQACAEPDIDGRSDQYSLAAVTYEMLAGQPPFVGPTAQAIIARQMLDQVPSLTIVRKTIPPELEDVVLRALSKVKADRFPTVGQFGEALQNPAMTQTWRTASRATMAQRRPWSPTKRRAVFAAWTLTFVGGGTGVGYATWKLVVQPARAVAAPAEATGGLDPRNVAVLYFADESREKQLGFLADGLTEGLIDQLGQARTLDVVSKNGVAAARTLDVSEDRVRDSLARALKVGTLVTGSVEEGGRGYRVSVRLVDAFSGADVARKSFEAPKQDELQIRDTLSAVVAEFLRRRIGDEVALREMRNGTTNTRAWSLAQRAERTRKEGESALVADSADVAAHRFAVADSLLAGAEALDPAWVAPSVSRAAIALRQAKVAPAADAASLVTAGLSHAEKALARDPRNADALEMRGSLNYVRFVRHLEPDPAKAKASLERARADLKAAVQLAPSQANAWQVLSHLYMQIPDFTEAKLAAQRAYEEDAYLANAADVIWRLYTASYELEQFADAEHWCDEGSRRYAGNPRFIECRLWLLTAPVKQPDVASAWRLVDSLRKVAPNAPGSIGGRRYQMAAAAVLARAGLADSARRVAVRNRAEAEMDPGRDLETFEAFVRVLLTDHDEAFRLLKSTLAANPDHWVALDQSTSWWWRPIKNDPRFAELRSAAH